MEANVKFLLLSLFAINLLFFVLMVYFDNYSVALMNFVAMIVTAFAAGLSE